MNNNTNTSTNTSSTTEPHIFAASTYFWTGAGNASQRRRNEVRHAQTAADYFAAIGMDIDRHDAGDVIATTTTANGEEIRARFTYEESCANVYKSLSVTRNGKKSNISTIRKVAAAHAETMKAQAQAKRAARKPAREISQLWINGEAIKTYKRAGYATRALMNAARQGHAAQLVLISE